LVDLRDQGAVGAEFRLRIVSALVGASVVGRGLVEISCSAARSAIDGDRRNIDEVPDAGLLGDLCHSEDPLDIGLLILFQGPGWAGDGSTVKHRLHARHRPAQILLAREVA
jgi:hypothetical protein